MIDDRVRLWIDPWLTRLARPLARRGISADSVTVAGFFLGMAAAACIACGWHLAGLGLILASRLADGMDGALARLKRPSDFGGYLDIVLDFAFYGAVPLAFVIHDPGANGLAGAVLLLSFYVNGTTFLAFAAIEARRQRAGLAAPKAFHFSKGLTEAGETLAVFLAFCLWPQSFPWLALIFAALCVLSAAMRIVEASQRFGGSTGRR